MSPLPNTVTDKHAATAAHLIASSPYSACGSLREIFVATLSLGWRKRQRKTSGHARVVSHSQTLISSQGAYRLEIISAYTPPTELARKNKRESCLAK